MKWILTLALSWTSAQACQAIHSPNILGKDVAAGNPAFARLDPAIVIAPTPLPGVRRIFHSAELNRIARANSIEPAAVLTDMCFERATATLTIEQLRPALERALEIEDAQIEILDYCR